MSKQPQSTSNHPRGSSSSSARTERALATARSSRNMVFERPARPQTRRKRARTDKSSSPPPAQAQEALDADMADFLEASDNGENQANTEEHPRDDAKTSTLDEPLHWSKLFVTKRYDWAQTVDPEDDPLPIRDPTL